MRRTVSAIALMSLTFGAVAAPLWAQSPEDVVATVDGVEITLAELLAARDTLPPQFSQQLSEDQAYDLVLDRLIETEVISALLAEESPSTRAMIANETRRIRASAYIRSLIEQDVTTEAVRRLYDETYSGAESGTEWNAAHILVESEAEAREIMEEVRDGANFEAVAAERSIGPSASSGGALGWFGPGTMVSEFEEAVAGMRTGDISEPVETAFGWHVIKLNEIRTLDAPTFEEAEPDLRNRLISEIVQEEVTRARGAAEVTRAERVDPSVISEDDPLGQSDGE